MQTDDDGILRFDLEEIRQELDLMEAGSRRGCLCSGCGSVTTVANQVLLMALGRAWVEQQPEFERLQQQEAWLQAAKQGFVEGLEQSVALLKQGLPPFSPSSVTGPVSPPMGPGAPSAN